MERLDEVLTEYQGKPGALIPVLQIAQGIFGYLPENVLKRIALRLGKSYSEVAGVVGLLLLLLHRAPRKAPGAGVPGHGLLRARRQAGPGGLPAGAGHRRGRDHGGRPVHPRGGALLRRVRPCAHDHDRRGRAPAREAAEAARALRGVPRPTYPADSARRIGRRQWRRSETAAKKRQAARCRGRAHDARKGWWRNEREDQQSPGSSEASRDGPRARSTFAAGRRKRRSSFTWAPAESPPARATSWRSWFPSWTRAACRP